MSSNFTDEVGAVAWLLSDLIHNLRDRRSKSLIDLVFLWVLDTPEWEWHESRQQKHDTEVYHVLLIFFGFGSLHAKLASEILQKLSEMNVKVDSTAPLTPAEYLVLNVMGSKESLNQSSEAHQGWVTNVPIFILELVTGEDHRWRNKWSDIGSQVSVLENKLHNVERVNSTIGTKRVFGEVQQEG